MTCFVFSTVQRYEVFLSLPNHFRRLPLCLSTFTHVGESWEISGVPGHESVAVNRGLIDDVDEGLTLVELIDKYKGLLVGQKIYKKFGNKFPLLVKFIDSRQGETILVPASENILYIFGNATFLTATMPS